MPAAICSLFWGRKIGPAGRVEEEEEGEAGGCCCGCGCEGVEGRSNAVAASSEEVGPEGDTSGSACELLDGVRFSTAVAMSVTESLLSITKESRCNSCAVVSSDGGVCVCG